MRNVELLGAMFAAELPCAGVLRMSVREFWSLRSPNSPSASSHALPAPKPSPTHAGHARLLNNRTDAITPKERPRAERITNDERA